MFSVNIWLSEVLSPVCSQTATNVLLSQGPELRAQLLQLPEVHLTLYSLHLHKEQQDKVWIKSLNVGKTQEVKTEISLNVCKMM